MTGYELTKKLIKTRKRFVLTATEQALYHELVNICNEDDWSEIFSVSNDDLCRALNITEKTLNSSRLTIIQAGLVYYRSGKSKRKYGEYSFENELTTVKFTTNATTNRGVNATTNGEVDEGVNTSDYIIKLKGKEKPKGEEGAATPFIEPLPVQPNAVIAHHHKPTLQQVKEYFWQQGKQDKAGQDEAVRFFNHYEGLGWMKGITPITNWRAFANTWISNPLPGHQEAVTAPKPAAKSIAEINRERALANQK